jgi:membrane-associated phospholipid phosphatase
MRARAGAAIAMLASVIAPPGAAAQRPASDGRAKTVAAAEALPASEGSDGADGFIRDVARDYVRFVSWETARWLGMGGAAALGMHAADETIREATQHADGPAITLTGGREYGALVVQVPLAAVWWSVGRAGGHPRAAEAGRDLLRAQLSAAGWTYAVKYAVRRTRPNGDPRSFPSGHASATFATATVLEEHYGWKVGVPAFAAAAYTAASRVTDDKHWASDVVFAAFLGLASGRTVTIRLRRTVVSMTPLIVPGGGGVAVHAGR